VAVRGRALVEGDHSDSQLIALWGEERVSGLYALDAYVQTKNGSLDLEAIVRSAITLELHREDGGETHRLHGIASKGRLIHDQDGLAVFKVTVVPRLWNLTQSKHSRIFTGASFPQILEAVLEDEGMPSDSYRLELTKSYPVREHVCQYKESSFDFVSRWLEREGIHYFFDHDGEREVVVFADANSAFSLISSPTVRYQPVTRGEVGIEGAHRVRAIYRSKPTKVTLFDNDPIRPSLDVRGSSPTKTGAIGEIVRWGDNFTDPKEAAREAALRAEEIASSRETFELDVKKLGLRAGFAFELADHPMPAQNGELFVTRLRHEAILAMDDSPLLELCGLPKKSGYQVTVEARRTALPFHPERVTAWPRITGSVDATIDGAASSDYAQLDEHGRYKVTFHFDESDLVDGSRSTFIRRLQPHGGSVEAFHFPLRKVTEVHVMFLGGDPDKPVLVGAAPNVMTPSKITAANHTKNVIHTGGDTRIEMEDAGGGQYVKIDVPTASTTLHMGTGAHNVMGTTTGKGNIVTGSNVLMETGAWKREDVTGSLTETYNASHTLTVAGAVTETQKTSITSTVTGTTTLTITGSLTETVNASVREEFLSTFTNTVTGGTDISYLCGMELTVTGGATETFDATYARTVTGTMSYVVTGTAKEEFGATDRTVDGTYNLTVDGNYTLRCASLAGDASQWNNTDALLDGLVDLYDELHGIDIKVMGATASAYGAMIKAYGQDKSTTGLSLVATGLKILLAGIHVEKKSVKIDTDGAQMEPGAFHIDGKGILIRI
jgi:type VI secretion system secreted protein VgrG